MTKVTVTKRPNIVVALTITLVGLDRERERERDACSVQRARRERDGSSTVVRRTSDVGVRGPGCHLVTRSVRVRVSKQGPVRFQNVLLERDAGKVTGRRPTRGPTGVIPEPDPRGVRPYAIVLDSSKPFPSVSTFITASSRQHKTGISRTASSRIPTFGRPARARSSVKTFA